MKGIFGGCKKRKMHLLAWKKNDRKDWLFLLAFFGWHLRCQSSSPLTTEGWSNSKKVGSRGHFRCHFSPLFLAPFCIWRSVNFLSKISLWLWSWWRLVFSPCADTIQAHLLLTLRAINSLSHCADFYDSLGKKWRENYNISEMICFVFKKVLIFYCL